MDLFMMNEAYPRIVPFYSAMNFGTDLDKLNHFPTDIKDGGTANIKILKDLLRIYKTIKSENKITSKDISKINKLFPKYMMSSNVNPEDKPQLIINFFDNIYLTLLGAKTNL